MILDQRQPVGTRLITNLADFGTSVSGQKQLYEKKLISKQDFEKTEADYKYNLEREDHLRGV